MASSERASNMEKVSLITLEEHFLLPELAEAFADTLSGSYTPPIHPKLLAVDQSRLDDMNSNGIEKQVISHIAFDTSVEQSRKINEALRARVAAHPSRLAAFASLPMENPSAAAAELEYAIKTLGFVGALVPNHLTHGAFYDGASYSVFFAKAQALDVPIYLHPAYPSKQARNLLYDGPWSPALSSALGGWCWGWHSTVGLHVLRLYAAGVFERFPRLKIIIGHMGEMLPFMLDRVYPISAFWPGHESRKRSLKEVWNPNIWVTTSGTFSVPVMRCLMSTTKLERIMFSVDYPLAPNESGLQFLQALRSSGEVTEEELHAIAYRNAATLLGLNASFAGSKA